jgi:hypothetical protein
MSQKVRDLLSDIAAEEVGADSQLRMFIVSFGAANWVALQMLLLYLADATTARAAVQLSMGVSLAVFGAYFIFSRAPQIAHTIEVLFTGDEVDR